MICVPSNIEIEDIEKLSSDLDQNEMFESSLNSLCFVLKVSIPLTCGQTLARYVNVFNTFVDDTNHSYDRKGRCPIPCLRDHSKVDCLNLSTCLRQIEVCQNRNSSFETVFEELERSTTQPFEHVLKVHLLQQKIERVVRKFKITTENAIRYETEIEKKIKDIEMLKKKKLLFDLKDKTSNQSFQSACRYDKYQNYFMLQKEHVENAIKCMYCIRKQQICHKPCGLDNQGKDTCKTFRDPNSQERTNQCNECQCKVDEHELGYFLSYVNEITDFKKITQNAKHLEDIIKKDYQELNITSGKLDIQVNCVDILQIENVADLELEDILQNCPSLKSKEEFTTESKVN